MSTDFIKEILFEGAIEKDSYLANIPSVRYLEENRRLPITHDITIFVGENGTGKSTLMEAVAVACGFNAEGGSRNFCFSTENTHSDLYKNIRISRRRTHRDGFFLRAESFYNVASNIDELDRQPAGAPPIILSYGGVSLHKQSHGESFLALVENRFGGNGLYILDEPEAALSPMRLLTLMAHINALVDKNSQFIISTHSPMLMAMPRAQIFELSQSGIQEKSYKDTEHYRVTKAFLNNPERILENLLG